MTAPGRPAAPPRPPAGDRGVSTLEFAGFLPILLLVGLAAVQLGLVGYAAGQAGSGARAAARVTAQEGSAAGEAAGHAAMDDGLDADVAPSEEGELSRATVTVSVPLLVPFAGDGWHVTRTVTMPTDE
ncbi:TadE/TadG family type IV pilus assembly protein [Streptomyces sp. LE64]|uniref:TadE/TadG family type IV pilus assembly protein n=1 Tax=Streptomyces sp. LE64 TaxID=3448653 RepID=UPI004041393F